MTCSPHDVRDYALGELTNAARAEVEAHVKTCVGCREELAQLAMARSALLELRDEEMPRRIAFVSDRVYEPSAAKRWWMAVWNSGPRLVFASAAMLSAAIVAGAWMGQPAPTGARAYSQTEVAAMIDRAVRASESKQAKVREDDIRAIEAGFEMLGKQVQTFQKAMYFDGSAR